MSDSLKQKALALLAAVENSDDACCSWDFTTVRAALESMSDTTAWEEYCEASLDLSNQDDVGGHPPVPISLQLY